MSASTAKASRRELRRALGPRAIDDVARLSREIADTNLRVEQLANQILADRQTFAELLRRTAPLTLG